MGQWPVKYGYAPVGLTAIHWAWFNFASVSSADLLARYLFLGVIHEHGELDVRLEGETPALGVLVHQLQRVEATHTLPHVHRLGQHLQSYTYTL